MTIMRKPDEHQGGTLSVSIEMIRADRHFCNAHPEAVEGDYWVFGVRDDGVGMDSRTVSKIFDPFFTTKEKGKGTGLGLAMVYNIVQQHKGFIDVYSEVGIGTTFHVYLPVFEGADQENSKEDETNVPQGEGIVLVVDDEAIIRQTAKAILEECGYTVITAGNGEEGVEVFRKRHSELKAVLLDMVMPKKSGKEAFLEMKQIQPAVRVLMASGFRQDERVQAVLDLGAAGFIQKPYTLKKLAQAIHQALQ
ncbi:MAG: response regulator [Bacillus subtilis]|nr:response regulator [Bacillus subtilis]